MPKSLDDILEEERQNKLEYRVGSHGLPQEPARPAQPSKARLNQALPKDHPSRDSNVDSDEEYHEG